MAASDGDLQSWDCKVFPHRPLEAFEPGRDASFSLAEHREKKDVLEAGPSRMAQRQPSNPLQPPEEHPTSAGQSAVPPGWVVRPPTNWKMLSGWVLFLGIALIGVAFLLLALSVAANSGGEWTVETFLSLLGFGIIVIGLSFAIGRMG